MSEYEELVEKLLAEKSDLTKESINDLVQQKKEKIGAGYLTDQGALFLIASDLGISLSEPLKVEMGLKEIYSGAKEISLETRMLSMSQPKQLSRTDGTPLYLRTMIVYDSDSAALVKLWNEKANLPSLNNIKPGDLIRIVKAYIKSELYGTSINIGSGASIEAAEGESDIPNIDAITKDVGDVKEGEKNLAVSGVIDGDVSCMQYTNAKGQRTAIKTRIKGNNGMPFRVVIWGKGESDIPTVISQGAKIRLLGVDVKTNDRGIEIHGTETTTVEIEGEKEATPITSRIISIAASEDDKKFIQSIDANKNIFNITDLRNSIEMYSEGDVIECMPSKIHGKNITLDSSSFVRKLEDDGTLPKLQDVRTKISEVAEGDFSYCIEAIILKISERRDVQTKTGDSIALSEMFVEDDTGPIWVKGWRNQARLIDGRELGEVVSITGLNPRQGLDGKIELFLSVFSKIIKKN